MDYRRGGGVVKRRFSDWYTIRKMEKKGISQSYKTIGNFTSRDIDFVLSNDYENEENLVEFLETSKKN